MSDATAAILLPAMATSICASTPFLGSITCPPLRIRSYWAAAAVESTTPSSAPRREVCMSGVLPQSGERRCGLLQRQFDLDFPVFGHAVGVLENFHGEFRDLACVLFGCDLVR